ncbi:hypothetical protein BZG36_04704 [Bifiguratus adelaidae]|uniref:Uncharacterized protein n=1 Tax=Bifiguratus adelaidae TaxID=1938954 RepID=A0A261XWL3_9FUNG|nr:hypothetical protein BZG36_04704 [Bifiguratus adelaidae]
MKTRGQLRVALYVGLFPVLLIVLSLLVILLNAIYQVVRAAWRSTFPRTPRVAALAMAMATDAPTHHQHMDAYKPMDRDMTKQAVKPVVAAAAKKSYNLFASLLDGLGLSPLKCAFYLTVILGLGCLLFIVVRLSTQRPVLRQIESFSADWYQRVNLAMDNTRIPGTTFNINAKRFFNWATPSTSAMVQLPTFATNVFNVFGLQYVTRSPMFADAFGELGATEKPMHGTDLSLDSSVSFRERQNIRQHSKGTILGSSRSSRDHHANKSRPRSHSSAPQASAVSRSTTGSTQPVRRSRASSSASSTENLAMQSAAVSQTLSSAAVTLASQVTDTSVIHTSKPVRVPSIKVVDHATTSHDESEAEGEFVNVGDRRRKRKSKQAAKARHDLLHADTSQYETTQPSLDQSAVAPLPVKSSSETTNANQVKLRRILSPSHPSHAFSNKSSPSADHHSQPNSQQPTIADNRHRLHIDTDIPFDFPHLLENAATPPPITTSYAKIAAHHRATVEKKAQAQQEQPTVDATPDAFEVGETTDVDAVLLATDEKPYTEESANSPIKPTMTPTLNETAETKAKATAEATEVTPSGCMEELREPVPNDAAWQMPSIGFAGVANEHQWYSPFGTGLNIDFVPPTPARVEGREYPFFSNHGEGFSASRRGSSDSLILSSMGVERSHRVPVGTASASIIDQRLEEVYNQPHYTERTRALLGAIGRRTMKANMVIQDADEDLENQYLLQSQQDQAAEEERGDGVGDRNSPSRKSSRDSVNNDFDGNVGNGWSLFGNHSNASIEALFATSQAPLVGPYDGISKETTHRRRLFQDWRNRESGTDGHAVDEPRLAPQFSFFDRKFTFSGR